MVYEPRYIIRITDIEDGSVSLDQLNSDSVDSSKIISGGVATSDIADGAITTEKLAQDVSVPIAPGAIGSTELATAACTESKIAPDAISNAKIQDGAVDNLKIAPDAVDTAEIVDDAVTNEKMAADSIGNQQIKNNAVRESEIKDLAVTKAKAELGFGRIVFLDPSISVYNVEDALDKDEEVDLSANVPAGAIGVLVGLFMEAGTTITTESFCLLRGPSSGPAIPFIALDNGAASGDQQEDTTLVKLFNPTNRTIKLEATKNALTIKIKIQLMGYVI